MSVSRIRTKVVASFATYHTLNIIIAGIFYTSPYCNDPNNHESISLRMWAIIFSLVATIGCTTGATFELYTNAILSILPSDQSDNGRILPPQGRHTSSWNPANVPWISPRSGGQSTTDISMEEQLIANPGAYGETITRAIESAIDRFFVWDALFSRNLSESISNIPLEKRHQYITPTPSIDNSYRKIEPNYFYFHKTRYSIISPEYSQLSARCLSMIGIISAIKWLTLYFLHFALLIYGTYRFATSFSNMCENLHVQRYSLSYLIISWLMVMSIPMIILYLIFFF